MIEIRSTSDDYFDSLSSSSSSGGWKKAQALPWADPRAQSLGLVGCPWFSEDLINHASALSLSLSLSLSLYLCMYLLCSIFVRGALLATKLTI